MPGPRGQKRKSNAVTDEEVVPSEATTQMIATKAADEDGESPSKKRRVGLTLANKQKLIDNLQLDITERARRLRAQYNEYAQALYNRVERRITKIPMSLRRMKMGDLMAKHSLAEQQKTAAPPASAARPPPVPPKDVFVGRPALQRTAQVNAIAVSPARPTKRPSEDISGGDKENEIMHLDNPKKKTRAANPTGAATRPAPNPAQVLSPASSNTRVLPPRERAALPPSPSRSFIARPVSPTKPASVQGSGVFSSMVEKARSTRAAATRKTTTSSTTSSANGSAATTTAATRTRKATAAAPASRAGATSRATRRVSAISESSDGSTGTVVRKRTTAAAAAAPAAKRTVMGTIRKGVAGAAPKKAAAAKVAPAPVSTGRVLRKRS